MKITVCFSSTPHHSGKLPTLADEVSLNLSPLILLLLVFIQA